ncbi:MAG: hypothetical protein M1825_004964 [Sarcosagium campestre]|nr:MAG: hypothetical protein M1825_004964 [Sarcosagium campestre]
MASSKSTKHGGSKPAKSSSPVKTGAVVKPSQTPKSKSKELVKKVAAMAEKVTSKSKKAKKEPTPVSESSEDSDSDESMASPDEESESESENESSSEVEVKKPVAAATNGASKSKKADPETSDSSESSESSASSESESEFEAEVAKPVANGKAKSAAAKPADDDSESSEDSESDEEEVPVKAKAAAKPAAVNGAAKKPTKAEDSSDEDSEDDSSEEESDVSSGESESESAEEVVSKKRKAVDSPAAPVKSAKAKTEAADETSEGGNNLFVGNLSWNVDEEWLAREFEEFGELSGTRVISDRNTGRSKGFGYVEFKNASDAAKALKAKKGTEIDGRLCNIDFSTPRTDAAAPGGFKERATSRAGAYGDAQSPESDTLFVGNVAFSANEDILGEEFGKWGTVTHVRLPTDPETGSIKGFAYVQFASVDEAKEALNNMMGVAIEGRPVRVDFSTPRPSTGDSPRGGRGGFGDRGGRGGGRGRGGFGDRGGRGGGRGGSTNRGGFNDFKGQKKTFG